MQVTHLLSLIIFTLGFHNVTYSMHSKNFVSTQKLSRSYLINLRPYDAQQGRRDAYQKWCVTPIQWNNGHDIKEALQASKKSPEDKMAFYKQFSKK